MSWNEETWDAFFAGQPKGETFWRIMRDVYGDDYPEEVEPACHITKSDLVRIAQWLSLGPGDTLADLGCGRGGAGLWLARELGADLVGVDLSREAIKQARQRIADFGLEGRARFIAADFCTTTLEDGGCDGAVCVDMVGFVPDKAAAMREVTRILRSGARFVLAWWVSTRPDEIDYRRLFEDGGFVVEEYYEKPDWKRHFREVYERILSEEAALIEEMGADAAGALIDDARATPVFTADRRRVFIVGRRL